MCIRDRCDLDAALFADHTAMLEALVLAAKTLVVLDRTKDPVSYTHLTLPTSDLV